MDLYPWRMVYIEGVLYAEPFGYTYTIQLTIIIVKIGFYNIIFKENEGTGRTTII